MLVEGVDQRSERRAAVCLPWRAAGDDESAPGREAGQFGQHAGLADAGFTGDGKRPAAPVGEPVERVFQGLSFPFAPDQRNGTTRDNVVNSHVWAAFRRVAIVSCGRSPIC
jgi:hypothetical protein